MFYIVGFCPEHRTHELAAGPYHEGWAATAKAWKLERAGWRSLLVTTQEPSLARHMATPKVGKFQQYRTGRAAHAAARRLAEGGGE